MFDFTFDEDQLALRDGMQDFFKSEMTPEALRKLWDSGMGANTELRHKIAEQGLCGLSIPESDGGLGLGDIDWALMTPEVGYFALPDFLLENAYIATGVLAQLPENHTLRQKYLAGIADGSLSVAIAHPINLLVANGKTANAVLLVKDNEVHLVETASITWKGAHETLDSTRLLAQIQTAQTSEATRLFTAQESTSVLNSALNRGAISNAGQLVGLAQRILDLSVEYVGQRKQFGKVIGSFQAVKHHLADVVVKIEFAKPVLYRAAYAIAHQHSNADLYVSHAKLVCAEAALLAVRKGIQVHGAMGYTWEVDVQMFAKRAWALNNTWGDTGFHKSRMISTLLANDNRALGPGSSF